MRFCITITILKFESFNTLQCIDVMHMLFSDDSEFASIIKVPTVKDMPLKCHPTQNTKSPQMVGLRSPMRWTNTIQFKIFPLANIMQINWLFSCVCNYCVHNVAKSKGSVGRRKVAANIRKLIRGFATPINTNMWPLCSIDCRLAGIQMSNYAPFPIWTSAFGMLG